MGHLNRSCLRISRSEAIKQEAAFRLPLNLFVAFILLIWLIFIFKFELIKASKNKGGKKVCEDSQSIDLTDFVLDVVRREEKKGQSLFWMGLSDTKNYQVAVFLFLFLWQKWGQADKSIRMSRLYIFLLGRKLLTCRSLCLTLHVRVCVYRCEVLAGSWPPGAWMACLLHSRYRGRGHISKDIPAFPSAFTQLLRAALFARRLRPLSARTIGPKNALGFVAAHSVESCVFGVWTSLGIFRIFIDKIGSNLHFWELYFQHYSAYQIRL